jgi:hypothetical protein
LWDSIVSSYDGVKDTMKMNKTFSTVFQIEGKKYETMRVNKMSKSKVIKRKKSLFGLSRK